MRAARGKKNTGRRILRIALSLLSLAALAVIAVVLINNGGKLDLAGLFSGLGAGGAKTYYFEDGKAGDFADLDGSFASVGVLGVQVFDRSGSECAEETVVMRAPVMARGDTAAAAYDHGGTALRILDSGGVKAKLTAPGEIISVSVNDSGWVSVCTREAGYRGMVTVYNASGGAVYEWHSGSGYVLASALTHDNRTLAVLTLMGAGSQIAFYDLDSVEERAGCTFENELLLDMRFTSDGSLLAVGANKLYMVDRDAQAQAVLDYTGRFLGAYSLDGSGFSAFAINDYQVGGRGELVTVDRGGRTVGTLRFERECVCVSAKGDTLAVLWQDELAFYDRTLGELGAYKADAEWDCVLMRADGTALLAGMRSAQVYSSAGND